MVNKAITRMHYAHKQSIITPDSSIRHISKQFISCTTKKKFTTINLRGKVRGNGGGI